MVQNLEIERSAPLGPLKSEALFASNSDSWTDSSVTCNVSANTGTYKPVFINIQANGKANRYQSGNAASMFSYTPPSVSSRAPANCPTAARQTLVINGTNLGSDASKVNVFVGSTKCTVVAVGSNHDKISCNIAAGSGAENIIIVAVDGQSATAFQP